MKSILLAAAFLFPVLAASGCAMSDSDKAAREWQRTECNRIIDQDAREKCLKNL